MSHKPTHHIREGTTDPITVELYDRDPETGDLTGVDITGFTLVEWVMAPRDGSAVIREDTGGSKVSVVQATAPAQVQFAPGANDIQFSSGGYDLYIEVTDGNGVITDFPSDRNALLEVLEAKS